MFNRVFNFTQIKFNFIYRNSLFIQNIDKLVFVSILCVYISSLFMSSDIIGFIALITIFLTLIKLIFVPGQKLDITKPELWLLAYFMFVIISLGGSSLFSLSLKGFVKTLTYMGFYGSLVSYLKNNKHHIPCIISVIGLCAGFESLTAIMQNFSHVEEISTWQDISSLNPEQIMTRVYGTLKPYNPNLMGGYFTAAVPALFAMSAYNIVQKHYKKSALWLTGGMLSLVGLVLTGCRGAYMGMITILAGIFLVSAKYLWENYKKIYCSLIGFVILAITTALLFVSSLRARVLSIFAMRRDSSNSFRFNVYHSSVEMFKDNWLLGIGIGNKNFREIYGLYMKTGFDALSAYNIFLETAVESGIFALAAFLGYLFILIHDAVKYIISSNKVKDVIFVSAGLISIVAVCVHGMVDTVFFRPQIQFVFWTMAAILRCVIYDLDS